MHSMEQLAQLIWELRMANMLEQVGVRGNIWAYMVIVFRRLLIAIFLKQLEEDIVRVQFLGDL